MPGMKWELLLWMKFNIYLVIPNFKKKWTFIIQQININVLVKKGKLYIFQM